MRDKNKILDEAIEAGLRKCRSFKASGDFTQHLMKRIAAENKSILEERRSDRIVKYVIGTFSFLMLGFTFMLGMMSKSASVSTDDSGGLAFNTMRRSNSILETMVSYIQEMFTSVLSFFGLSLSSGSINIILVVVLVAIVYLVGERLFLRGKLKSSIEVK